MTQCDSKDCFVASLNYSGAPLDQLAYLAELSASCRQRIDFDCLHAPISDFGSWIDRNGERQTYFTGSNFGEKICGCSENSTCKYSPKEALCNCDHGTHTEEWLEDSGYVTNSSALPIAEFRYGLLMGKSQAKITVGPLECSGETIIGAAGTSCATYK